MINYLKKAKHYDTILKVRVENPLNWIIEVLNHESL